MLKDNVMTEESQALPAISPEFLAELKKEDMTQAVVERFRRSVPKPAAPKTVRKGTRSPSWRPADEEC
jgi:hypothetical protein